MGEALLRVLYRRLKPPLLLYRATAEKACSTRPRLLLDVGGGSGLLMRALPCLPSLYVLLDPDPVLVEAGPRAPWVERVVADGRMPPLRASRRCTLVLHDSLHHIPGWRAHLRRMLDPCDCLVVNDYDPGTLRGRLLALFERLLGFPAEFTSPRLLSRELEGVGFRVVRVEEGFNYRLVACRHSK